MLSEEEYRDILYQLDQPSSETSADTTKKLRKKLKEHEYSTKFAPFDPLQHTPYFINRTTSQQNLHKLIQAATTSTEFVIDTESWNVFRQTNKPALIQVQILPRDSSLVLLVEVCHLPKEDDISFKIMQQLFEKIFTSGKTIFIFGPKDELYPFVQFKLFSHDQIRNVKIINLQDAFKIYWNIQHPHKSVQLTSLTTYTNCICEACIGKKPSELWSLQDCVAYLLHEYLPKTLSNENFQIGLDPELFALNRNEQQYRNRLSTYAKNDCLSMQRLIIQMKKHQFNFNSTPNIPTRISQKKLKFILPKLDVDIEIISSDDEFLSEEQIANQILSTKKLTAPSIDIPETKSAQNSTTNDTPEQPSTLIPHDHRYPFDWESMITNGNHSNVNHEQPQSINYPQPKLSAEERKRIHNRSCTRRQRRRYYRHEIICQNIERRFTITQIKTILRQNNVTFSAVNTSKSSTSNKTSLYIGIKQTDKMDEYKRITQNLFTTAHYRSVYRNRQPTSSSNYRTSSSNRISQNHRQRERQQQ